MTVTLTGTQEAGHTDIRPLLCHVPEAVAAMIALAV